MSAHQLPRSGGAEQAPQGFDEDGATPAPERRGHAVIRDYLRRLDERPSAPAVTPS